MGARSETVVAGAPPPAGMASKLNEAEYRDKERGAQQEDVEREAFLFTSADVDDDGEDLHDDESSSRERSEQRCSA